MYKTRKFDGTILNFKNVERIFYGPKYIENINFVHKYGSSFVLFSFAKKKKYYNYYKNIKQCRRVLSTNYF